MVWLYIGVVVAIYAAIFLFRDDACEDVRKWLYPALLILAIGGGYMLSTNGGDDDCTSYSFLVSDC